MKAKVEAYNRNSGDRMNMPMIGGGAYAPSAGAGAGAGGGRSNPGSRRGSEVDHSYAAAAEESSLYEPSVYSRGSRASSHQYEDDYGNGKSEAERRIAQIKQQREREKERENALKEMEVHPSAVSDFCHIS